MTRIAHLSDPHLDTGAERFVRLRGVLQEVAELDDVDLILVSGDIADHGAEEEYAQFVDALQVPQPTIIIPGNHDLRAPMSKHIGGFAPDGYLNVVRTVGGVTVVGLDSVVEHHDEGRLSAETLEFAHTAVEAATGPVVLSLHHPPVPVGHEVMDRFGLRNADDLAELVHRNDSIAAVLTGHVHTALATTFAGRPLMGAPGIASTMRLGSRTDPIADGSAMPGMALHTLDDDGRLSTIFHYLAPAERP